MKSFFKFSEKNSKKPGKALAVFFLVLMSFSFLFTPLKPVQAQAVVFDSFSAALKTGSNIFDKTANAFKYLWQKGGSMAFQQTLRTVLNTVAMDTAKYAGSGGQGQKPLFITKPWAYVADLGDEAAGAYLENFASNMAETSSCDKKKKDCVDACWADPSLDGYASRECESQCSNICIPCAKQKAQCKKTCDSSYSSTVNSYKIDDTTGMPVYEYTEDLAAGSVTRTNCYSACDSSCSNTADTGLNSGQATPSFNVCQPSSIDAKLRITLGLAEQNRAQAPDCKATDIVKNWGNLDNYGNSVAALKDLYNQTQPGGYNDQLFLNDIKGIFDPRGNDIGIFLSAKTDSATIVDKKKTVGNNLLVGKGGWLDVQDIAGNTKSLPNQAKLSTEQSYKQYSDSFGKYTGDAFVDALNTFLSQTAFTAFNSLMQNLGKTSTQGSNSSPSADPTNKNNGNSQTGEGAIKDAAAKLSQPDFSARANYDILSLLSMCQNAANPGPTDCVIDNKFMQAIAEHKTVIEAIKNGSLNGTWRLTSDNVSDAYTLRNISILRKYRILPVGWEAAIQKAKENNVNVVTLNDLVSCFDLGGDYKQFSSSFDQSKQDWCRSLVDPNWVLKAPLNYCSKEGIGGQVLNFTVSPGLKAPGQLDTLSTYNVTRAENYCADNQTCIKEKNNGSCDAYGYCSEEKRTWNFGVDSCKPINNTCKTFSGGASSKTVSYLQNTLDYSNCNAASAGCRQYSLTGDYASSSVIWDPAKSLFFNNSQYFTTCDQSAEGCTSLIRAKTSQGTNLVINSDFSADKAGDTVTKGLILNSWPLVSTGDSWNATIVDKSDPIAQSNALKLEASGDASSNIFVALYSDSINSLVPKDLQIISGQAYTLSADVYLVSGDKVQATIGSNISNTVYSEIGVKNSWQHITVTRSPIDSYNQVAFFIRAYGTGGQITAYVKNIKFEASNLDNGYAAYGSSKIYEKLLPNYLEKACYIDTTSGIKNYNLKSDAPAVCGNYARKCNKDEVGCELYKSDSSNFSIAAQVASADLCPQECVGYDVYISRLNTFSSPQKENMIPTTAQKCNAEEAGCSEFTNLDSINKGGESKEYYTDIKQCIKPSTSSCGSYYAWEGTENGYQLKSYTLKKGIDGPDVTSDDSGLCNSEIYHSKISSPEHNSNCLEFYNSAGKISYHLINKTITCSDDCHPYRLTEKNIDTTVSSAAECVGTDRNWDVQNNACRVCLNGGTWDLNQSACVYQVIPNEGKTCQASAKNCREYNGANGENVRLISASDFENNNSWFSNCANGLSLSSIASTNNGHSLKYNNNANSCQAVGESVQTTVAKTPLIKQILATDDIAAQFKVGQSVSLGKAYNISFLARANSDTNLKIYFYNKETKDKSFFNMEKGVTVNGTSEWQIYRASLENLDHVVSDNELLVISANNDFYLDNFVLNEVSERYYLIKNSSQVQASCYYDNFNVYQGTDYNLGCSQYSDRANVKHNFRQFSKLCAESGVGCEQMIDTKNYSPGGSGFWNDTNNNKKCDPGEVDCVEVSGDTAIFAVYDLKKQCNVSDLGCSRLGQGTRVGNSNLWTDVFRRNNPDNYSSILCRQASVGCEKWTDNNGETYFKDPGDNTCVYRAAANTSTSLKNWYKSAVKRCDKDKTGKIEGAEMNTATCLSNTDCGTGNSCISDSNDYACTSTNLKTLGLGGNGNQVLTPDQAVGLCETKESGCTEYIDPISAFVTNLVYNSDYQTTNGRAEGWGKDTFNNSAVQNNEQVIQLETNKLYIFKAEANNGKGDTKLTFNSDVKPLLNSNILGTTTRELTIRDAAAEPILFYTLNNSQNSIPTLVSGALINKSIIVKPAVIDYQLQSNIDNQACNGNVNFDQGCVLFNERSINGANGLATLKSNAYTSLSSPANCSGAEGSCNTNKLVKVQPDRICSKWLSCVTYIKDANSVAPTCYALGECNSLSDDNKECANYVDNNATTPRIFDSNRDKNSSGYSLMDRYYFGHMKEVGANSDFHYDFEDPSLSCQLDTATGGECSFPSDSNIAKELLIREKTAKTADYPAHGKSFLKVPSGFLISPQGANSGVSLMGTHEYYLNFLINTRNSGVGGKVYIKYKNSQGQFKELTSAVYSSKNGWERKIMKFKTNGSDVYRVELGSDLPIQDGQFVYFDDLNIEPVLEVAPNKYVSRECRLYPETSSLTCNDSLARDGFEGYCLEHDLKNPAVCTMWYPVDHINSAKAGVSMSGYNGVSPLNYCTQVNGNFDLVEKRVAIKVYDGESKRGCIGCTAAKCGPDGTYFYFPENTSQAIINSYALTMTPSGQTYTAHAWGSTTKDPLGGYDNDEVYNCNSNDYVLALNRNRHCEGGPNHFETKVACVPINNANRLVKTPSVNLDFQVGGGFQFKVPDTNGWYSYNGFPNAVTYDCGNGVLCPSADESKNAVPAVQVYDYNYGANQNEASLKFISGNDQSKNFRLTCDTFSQVVNSNGDNLAWSNRISNKSIYPTTTPAFFLNSSYAWYGAANNNLLARYGRNRENIPFGAAVLPVNTDLLSGGKVNLRNQYSVSENENIFAGRPYGCSNNGGVGSGCANIGSCSLNPDIYCLISSADAGSSGALFNVGTKSCGEGSCLPLWNKSLSASSAENPDYADILKTLFLKTFSSYSYSYSNSTYSASLIGSYDKTTMIKCGSPASRDDDNSRFSFCAIFPQIKNISLKLNGNVINGAAAPHYTISQRGVYELDFNTIIDKEQQPLKEIYIDWNDGTDQTISGQDSKSAIATPHVVYHYYNKTGDRKIQIKVTDNWGKFNPPY